MKKVFYSILFLVLAASALMFWPAAPVAAQAPSAFPYAYPLVNDATTGTVQFTLTCMTSSGYAVECSGGVTNGYRGVCVSNCGKNGSAWIAFAGLVPLTVDGTTTVNHYIQFGATAGEGHDSGASTIPTSGGTVIGQVQQASTGAASVSMVNINPEGQAAGSGGTSNGGVLYVGNCTGGVGNSHTTALWSLGGGTACSGSVNLTNMATGSMVARSCTLKNLQVGSNAGAGASDGIVTVQYGSPNGAATASNITCTVATNHGCNDMFTTTGHSQAVTAGDEIYITVAGAATSSVGYVSATVECD